jgi:hypothetical protein
LEPYYLSCCSENETIDHLFFQCHVAKIIWGIIGFCIGANNIPRNLRQYKTWVAEWLPKGRPVYIVGCAAVCWAIWKCRNKACFDKKMIKNPLGVLIHVCSFLSYWAGLYNSEMQGKILEGVQALLACAHKMMEGQPAASSTAKILPSTAEKEREDDEPI